MKEMLATRCSAAYRTLASSLAALGLLLAAAPAAKAQTCDVLQITDSAGTVARDPSLDAGRIAFASNADLTGGNADGNFEIFLWDGAAIEQVTDTAVGPLAAESGEPSLDGGLLAFTSNADLTGGNPDGNFEIFLWDGASFTQITDATAGHSFEPSLDGGSIAFTSTADLTGGNPDGSSEIFLWDGAAITQVTASADGSDQPSLQGGRIAFSSNGDLTGGNPEGNFEIFFWDGATTVQVTDAAAGNSVQPSLDAALLAFTSLADLTGGNPDGSSEIFVWDGATIVQLTDAAIPSQGSSEPSADAGTIAFRSSADLTGANPDLGGEIFLWDRGIVQVTDSPDPAVVAFGPSLDAGSVAVWSDADFAGGNADGNFEIFVACPPAGSVLEVPALGPLGAALLALLLVAGGLWRLRATAASPRPGLVALALLLGAAPAAQAQVCEILQITDAAGAASQHPSLDAGRVAFASNADLTGGNPDGNSEIFLWDGGALQQLTDTPLGTENNDPRLDGGLLAFGSSADLTGGNPDGNIEIFLWDGAGFTQITDSSSGGSFQPSLDGGSIAFSSNADLTGGNPDGSFEIFLWDGASTTQITSSTENSLQSSLEGGRVAFVSNADLTGGNPDGNPEIFFWDGTTTTQVTDAVGLDSVQPSLGAALLAFTSEADLTGGNPDGSQEIFVWDGSTILQLTDGAALGQGSSTPSAEGGSIAFRSFADLTGGNPDLGGELFLWNGSSIVQITDSPDPVAVALNPSLENGSIAFWSSGDFTGENPDGSPEIFLACPQGSSVLEVPALGPLGAALLALLLVAGGLWRLRATRPALLVVALLLCGLAGTAGATPVTEGAPLLVGDNLLANPGFASDLSAWDAVSSDTVETSWTAEDLLGRSDSGAMRVRNISDNAGHSVAVAGQCVPVMPGESYTFGGWTLAGAGQSYRGVFYQFRFRTNADCSGDTLALEALDVSAATAGRWHEAAREVVAPAGAMSASLRFLVRRASGDPADDVEVLFDELFILEGGATGCASDPRTACIGDRFAITVDYETTLGGGAAGAGTAVPLTSLGIDRGAIFWFFSPSNPELLIKVLDACSFSDHYWVFYSAGTNVGFDVRIVDVLTGNEWTSHNPDRTAAPPVQDTGALPCAVP